LSFYQDSCDCFPDLWQQIYFWVVRAYVPVYAFPWIALSRLEAALTTKAQTSGLNINVAACQQKHVTTLAGAGKHRRLMWQLSAGNRLGSTLKSKSYSFRNAYARSTWGCAHLRTRVAHLHGTTHTHTEKHTQQTTEKYRQRVMHSRQLLGEQRRTNCWFQGQTAARIETKPRRLK